MAEKQLKPPRKSKKADGLPSTREEWVSYVNNLHDEGLERRRKFELQWVRNLAYFLGYQDLVFRPNTGLIEFPNSREEGLTVNRIGSFVENRHAKLTRNRPVTRAIPNSNDPLDKMGAKATDQLLMHLWRSLEMEEQYDRTYIMMLTAGTAFMKTVWDDNIGEFVKQPKVNRDGDLEIDAETGEVEEKIFLGDVSSKALSPYALIPGDDSLPRVRDQPWFIERLHMTIEEVEDMWPHLKDKLPAESENEKFTSSERAVFDLSTPVFSDRSGREDRPNDPINRTVLVKFFWKKPGPIFKNGVLCGVVGSELGMIDIFPHEYGPNIYPFVKFTEKDDGYHFWPQSSVERLIPIQRAYNSVKRQKQKNHQLMANGKWLLAKGSGVSEEAITDESGEVIEYNPNTPAPSQASIAPMPNYVIQYERDLITDFRDVGGQRETSVSPSPNLTAAVALQVAQEQEDSQIGPLVKRLGRSMRLVAIQQLMLANEEYDTPRKVIILNESEAVGVEFLSSVDLRNHVDIHIEIESMIPDFRGAKRQALLDLWDRRVIDDPKALLKAFRFGSFDDLIEGQEKIEENIHLDIQQLKKGKQPEIHPVQNHVEYVKLLTKFIQSPEFLRLIPERKQLFIQNMQQHLEFLVQSLPQQGAPLAQRSQNSVGTPFGAQVPVGAPGNQGQQS